MKKKICFVRGNANFIAVPMDAAFELELYIKGNFLNARTDNITVVRKYFAKFNVKINRGLFFFFLMFD